jgi:hypothetical protein
MFFQPPGRLAAVRTEPEPSADPAIAVAQSQIEIARQAAAADAEIKRMKAAADIEIAQWKARQWAEIERYKAGLKAQLDEHELQHRLAPRSSEAATLRSSEGTALKGLDSEQ